MRVDGRAADALREIEIIQGYTKHAHGSVLVSYGDTKVICTANVVDGRPRFLRDTKQGWLTAEYSMLPSATHERSDREAVRGKQSGRTQEIQRLIGRALRAVVDLRNMGDYTIAVDCDVIQADGGTRTASITGACVAVADAIRYAYDQGKFSESPLKHLVAAVSVGIVDGTPVLDLNYAEDSAADTDMNIIMNEEGKFIEVQGTAEGDAFTSEELHAMMQLAQKGIAEIIEKQKAAVM